MIHNRPIVYIATIFITLTPLSAHATGELSEEPTEDQILIDDDADLFEELLSLSE